MRLQITRKNNGSIGPFDYRLERSRVTKGIKEERLGSLARAYIWQSTIKEGGVASRLRYLGHKDSLKM